VLSILDDAVDVVKEKKKAEGREARKVKRSGMAERNNFPPPNCGEEAFELHLPLSK